MAKAIDKSMWYLVKLINYQYKNAIKYGTGILDQMPLSDAFKASDSKDDLIDITENETLNNIKSWTPDEKFEDAIVSKVSDNMEIVRNLIKKIVAESIKKSELVIQKQAEIKNLEEKNKGVRVKNTSI